MVRMAPASIVKSAVIWYGLLASVQLVLEVIAPLTVVCALRVVNVHRIANKPADRRW